MDFSYLKKFRTSNFVGNWTLVMGACSTFLLSSCFSAHVGETFKLEKLSSKVSCAEVLEFMDDEAFLVSCTIENLAEEEQRFLLESITAESSEKKEGDEVSTKSDFSAMNADQLAAFEKAYVKRSEAKTNSEVGHVQNVVIGGLIVGSAVAANAGGSSGSAQGKAISQTAISAGTIHLGATGMRKSISKSRHGDFRYSENHLLNPKGFTIAGGSHLKKSVLFAMKKNTQQDPGPLRLCFIKPARECYTVLPEYVRFNPRRRGYR